MKNFTRIFYKNPSEFSLLKHQLTSNSIFNDNISSQFTNSPSLFHHLAFPVFFHTSAWQPFGKFRTWCKEDLPWRHDIFLSSEIAHWAEKSMKKSTRETATLLGPFSVGRRCTVTVVWGWNYHVSILNQSTARNDVKNLLKPFAGHLEPTLGKKRRLFVTISALFPFNIIR